MVTPSTPPSKKQLKQRNLSYKLFRVKGSGLPSYLDFEISRDLELALYAYEESRQSLLVALQKELKNL